MAEYSGYCVKCREKDRKMKDSQIVEIKGKGGTRKTVQGKCEKCGTKMVKMLPKG